MASCHLREYGTKTGPRWAVDYRLGGRGSKRFHGGSYKSREEAEERREQIAMCMAAGEPIPHHMRGGHSVGKSWVYFIEGGGLTKIGRGMRPEKRLSMMQTGSPVPLTLVAKVQGGLIEEQRLHHHFREYRKQGEWFALPDDWRRQVKGMYPADFPRRDLRDEEAA